MSSHVFGVFADSADLLPDFVEVLRVGKIGREAIQLIEQERLLPAAFGEQLLKSWGGLDFIEFPPRLSGLVREVGRVYLRKGVGEFCLL